jgi:hypothetical protein
MSATPDQLSTNKYYASGNKSVIDNSFAHHPLTPIPTPNFIFGDPSTDKYYNAAGSVMGRQGQPLEAAAAAPAADLAARITVAVNSQGEIAAAIGEVCARLGRGDPRVVVELADPAFERPIRTDLELRVAREQLTPDQYRDVRFSTVNLQRQQAFLAGLNGTVTPAEAAMVAGEDADDDLGLDLGDPAAFVYGPDRGGDAFTPHDPTNPAPGARSVQEHIADAIAVATPGSAADDAEFVSRVVAELAAAEAEQPTETVEETQERRDTLDAEAVTEDDDTD